MNGVDRKPGFYNGLGVAGRREARRSAPGGWWREEGAEMLFMVIERFKGRDPVPVYARLRERGRSLPEGVRYIDSWVEANFERCFQVVECDDVLLLQRWILEWRDLVEFEVVPVSASRDVRELFAPPGQDA